MLSNNQERRKWPKGLVVLPGNPPWPAGMLVVNQGLKLRSSIITRLRREEFLKATGEANCLAHVSCFLIRGQKTIEELCFCVSSEQQLG